MDNQQLIRNVIFNIETADGSALAGQDYSFLSVELTFNPVNYQQLQCISISTVDDSLIEGEELFFVDMKTKSSQVSIDPGRLTVNISAAGAQVMQVLKAACMVLTSLHWIWSIWIVLLTLASNGWIETQKLFELAILCRCNSYPQGIERGAISAAKHIVHTKPSFRIHLQLFSITLWYQRTTL